MGVRVDAEATEWADPGRELALDDADRARLAELAA